MTTYHSTKNLGIWLGCGFIFIIYGLIKLPEIIIPHYVVGLLMLCVWWVKASVPFITIDDSSLIVNPGMRKIRYRLADIETPSRGKNSIEFTHKVKGKSKKAKISTFHLDEETVEKVLADLKQALEARNQDGPDKHD
jgi:hypothetical protein